MIQHLRLILIVWLEGESDSSTGQASGCTQLESDSAHTAVQCELLRSVHCHAFGMPISTVTVLFLGHNCQPWWTPWS